MHDQRQDRAMRRRARTRREGYAGGSGMPKHDRVTTTPADDEQPDRPQHGAEQERERSESDGVTGRRRIAGGMR